MDAKKRAKLESAGFHVVDDAADWLELSPDERRLVEFRIAASRAVKVARLRAGLTQKQLAGKLNSSQPRVALIEAGASDVSLDLTLRALFASGGELTEIIRSEEHTAPNRGKYRKKAAGKMP